MIITPGIIDAVILVGSLGLFCGLVLSIAAHYLSIRENPQIEEILNLLPNANCGACGYTTCRDYAKAISTGAESASLCKMGGPETAQKIAAYMGIESPVEERKVAVVLCAGDDSAAKRKFLYNGIADCAAANLIGGGDKVCPYGCLGLGTCDRVCPVGAIEITSARLAVVYPEKCIGCGLCVSACPRHLIKLVPADRTIHVLCSSRETGAQVREKCSVGCIGCTLCTKITDAIKMDGALAIVDYDKPLTDEAVILKCPQHTIQKRIGMMAQKP